MDPFEKIRVPKNPNGSLPNFNDGFVDLDYGFPEELRSKKQNKEEINFNVNTVKIIFRFVSSKLQFDKEFGLPRSNPNDIYIYVEKPKDLKILGSGNYFSEIGLHFNDIINIFGISLGKNRVIKIEKDTKNEIDKLIGRIFRVMEIKKENHTYHYGLFSRMIHQFVTDYPSNNYDPPNALDKTFELLMKCIRLGVIDINNGAEFISKEIFQALANQIRKAKMTEERWNPNIATIKYFPKEKSGDKYNPLIPTLNDFNNNVNNFFSNHKNLNYLDSNKLLKSEYSVEKKSLLFNISSHASFVTNQLFDAFEFIIIENLDNISTYLKAHNALLVGLINGIIELVASIIEAIGFIIGLLNYENIKKLTDSIGELIKNFDLKKVFKSILKEIKKLFQFIDDDIIYKNAYEFGLFIPKIVELIIDVIGLAKGISKVAKSVSDIITEMAEALKKVNKSLNDLKIYLTLKIISKDFLQELKQLGITLEIRLMPTNNLNAGIPIKIFDGKIIKVKYRNIDLFESLRESDVNKLLKEISNDPDKLIELYRKKKRSILEKSKNFKKHKQNIKNIRTKYGNDTKNIIKNWNASSTIIKNHLSKNRAKYLDKYRKARLKFANIATGKVKVYDKKGNLIFERNDYIKGSGTGKIKANKDFTHGSIDKESLFQNIDKKDFFDKEEDISRFRDSENALLRDIEEDIIIVADKKGIDIDDLTIKIELESTYIPCVICKREILLRTQVLGKKTTIEITYPILKNGISVIDNDSFTKFLKQ